MSVISRFTFRCARLLQQVAWPMQESAEARNEPRLKCKYTTVSFFLAWKLQQEVMLHFSRVQ